MTVARRGCGVDRAENLGEKGIGILREIGIIGDPGEGFDEWLAFGMGGLVRSAVRRSWAGDRRDRRRKWRDR
jgi:hypothetical protein